MRTIGLIGGTSWTSTLEYYRYLNEETARRLGPPHSACLVLASLDFAALEHAMHSDRWDAAAQILICEGQRLHRAGAESLLLCSNLIHLMVDEVQAAVPLPILHIGDAVAGEVRRHGFRAVGLLGAKPTMEWNFYADRIRAGSGADILIPPPEERDYVDTAIFTRMCCNVYTEGDRAGFRHVIDGLKARGAEAVILGCTELPVLLESAALPLLNSTLLHSRSAVTWALGVEKQACPAPPIRLD